ncbi:hypothetical protein LCGC14_2426310, partial [marine sediment metagenome]
MAIIPALTPVISDVTLAAAAISVVIKVPSGFEILFLEWENVGSTDTADRDLEMAFNGDNAGTSYDDSWEAFGTASSTTNGVASIVFSSVGDSDALNHKSSGYAVIFNRDGQEKVVIGSSIVRTTSTNAQLGYHMEAKWRTTAGVITSIAFTLASGRDFSVGTRFILRGLRTNKAPALGSKDIVQFIGSYDAGGDATIDFTIPPGYEQLWLFWNECYGSTTRQSFRCRFN